MTTAAPEGPVMHESPLDVGLRQRLGVLLLIAGDVAFVLSLVFTYLYLRGLNTEGAWIPQGGRVVGTGLGWVIAAVMVGSWLAYRWAETGAHRPERLQVGLLTATLLVLADLVLQAYQLGTAGIKVHDGAYASSWMALAGYHAVHLALTLFIGVGIWNRARLGLLASNTWHVRLVGYWWAWVAVSAVLTATVTSLTTTAHVTP